jgi:hypothetical protein
MPAGKNRRRPSPKHADRPTFSVERFAWGAPDRLDVAGTFSGLDQEPPPHAILTVIGEEGNHRLPAVAPDAIRPPDGSGHWSASFAWLEAPVAFDRARLELGTSLAIELPGPGSELTGDALPVESLDGGEDGPDPAPAASGLEAAADRLRLETQLLEEAEELEDARAAARRADEELQRVRADLATEREGRAADAERFREGLATVRRSAEEALAAAAAARAENAERARTEIAALRERIAELEPAGAELDSVRGELDSVRGELDAARGTLSAARASAQELVDRLSDPETGGR